MYSTGRVRVRQEGDSTCQIWTTYPWRLELATAQSTGSFALTVTALLPRNHQPDDIKLRIESVPEDSHSNLHSLIEPELLKPIPTSDLQQISPRTYISDGIGTCKFKLTSGIQIMILKIAVNVSDNYH